MDFCGLHLDLYYSTTLSYLLNKKESLELLHGNRMKLIILSKLAKIRKQLRKQLQVEKFNSILAEFMDLQVAVQSLLKD